MERIKYILIVVLIIGTLFAAISSVSADCSLLMMVRRAEGPVPDEIFNAPFDTLAAHALADSMKDGWGISYFDRFSFTTSDGIIYPHTGAPYTDNRYASWKEVYDDDEFEQRYVPAYENIRDNVNWKLIAAHVRKGTTGGENIVNPHPFVFEKGGRSFTFAHNGTIRWTNLCYMSDFIWDLIDSGWCQDKWQKYTHRHGVDSRVYFGYLMAHIKLQDWDILRGLKEALSTIPDDPAASHHARNFILSQGFDMYAYRYPRIDTPGMYPLEYEIIENQDCGIAVVMTELPIGNGYGQNTVSLQKDELVYIPHRGNVQHFEYFTSDFETEVKSFQWVKRPQLSFLSTPGCTHRWSWDSFPVLDPVTETLPGYASIHTVTQDYDAGGGHVGSGDGFDYALYVRDYHYNNINRSTINCGWSIDYPLGLEVFKSEQGYKMRHDVTEGPGLDLSARIRGEICPLDIETEVKAGQSNWTGHWLLNSQSVQDALGSDFRQYVHSVQAVNWHWVNHSQSTIHDMNFPMEFGQMYKIILKPGVADIVDFTWFNSRQPFLPDPDPRYGIPVPPSDPEYFSFEPGPDYQTIEISEIETTHSISEIGVFPEYFPDTCIGASGYDGSPLQIFVYPDPVDGVDITGMDLTFSFLDEFGNIITSGFDVEIWDYDNEVWIEVGPGDLVAGFGQYCIVKLIEDDDPPEDPPEITGGTNYPNPSNPRTTISFTLQRSQHLNVVIYNIRGQKVKILADGQHRAGRYSLVWEGKDDRDRPVSSGVYFYRITAGTDEINGRILMLK